MKDIVDESKRRKLNRPITGDIENDRIWEQWYDEDVFKQELPKMNMKDYLMKANLGYENDTILNNRGMNKYSISELDTYIMKFAKALLASGISKGDRICAIGLSTPELVALSYACFSVGAVMCQLNYMDAHEGNGYLNKLYKQINTVSPKMVFTLDLLEDSVSDVLNLPEFKDIEKVDLPLDYSVPGHFVEKAKIRALKSKNLLSNKFIRNKVSMDKFLNRGNKISDEFETVYEEKLASNIAFTSGTTGENKAVLLSHDANNALAFQHTMAKLGLDRGNKHLVLVPPFLAFWTSDMIHMAMSQGIENILELALTYENIPVYLKKYLPQYGIWSQYLWDSILHMSDEDLKLVSSHLSKVVIGGERAEANQVETFFKKTGIVQEAGFGASEVNTCFTVANPRCYAIGSSGIPLPYNNVKILDEDGNKLTYGKAGRLFITGPCLMNGYFKRDDLTKKALVRDENGVLWYNTKDYAMMDKNGNLFVLDRAQEPVNIKVGKNHVVESVQLLDIVEKIKVNTNIKICKLSSYDGYTVLHVVIDEFRGISESDAIESIKETIKENLDEKYYPNIIYVEQSLPRTKVGKVDYPGIEKDTKELITNNRVLPEDKLIVVSENMSKKLKK